MQGQSECLTENDVVNDAYEYKWLTDELLPLKNPVGENMTYFMDRGDDVTPETNIPSWLKEHALGAACYGNTNLVPSFCRTYTDITKRQVLAVHAAKGSTRITLSVALQALRATVSHRIVPRCPSAERSVRSMNGNKVCKHAGRTETVRPFPILVYFSLGRRKIYLKNFERTR